MADRTFNNVQALDKKVVWLHGVINLSAAAAVSSSTILGASVAKTTTGTYTITLADKYPELLAVHAQFGAATAVDQACQIGAVDVASAGTIVIRTQVAATATDVSAAAQIYVSICLKNSTIEP